MESPSAEQETLLNQLTRLGEVFPQELQQPRIPSSGIPAAVIAPLLLPRWESKIEECRLLFIKRADSLRTHSGQIAFPGGVVEEQDPDLLSAGYREASEEVGLRREDSKLLATLPQAFTPSGFLLQPFFVASIQTDFIARPEEVDSIHFITLDELLNCPVRLEHREYQGHTYRVIYFDTSTVCVWGVTGRIVEVLLQHFFGWTAPQ